MSTTQVSLLSNHNTSTVVLKWTTTLAENLDRELYNVLEGITGVERVYMRRYSAELEYASHVTTADKLIEELRELFAEEDGPIAEVFGSRVKVTP